jgi:3-methylcrotonyl-CoA carboxylase beta subunit
MSRMSAKGLKQYTLSTGGNTAGGAYTVYLACESIMIDKLAYSFLGGPPMVKSAIGEEVTMQDLGGAKIHTSISGGADHFVTSQDEGIEKLRELLSHDPPQRIYADRQPERLPRVPDDHLYKVLPSDPYRSIDVRQVIAAIADDSAFSEYKRNYCPGRGDNIVCGKIRLKGLSIGVVASNSIGVIFVESARKAAEWIVRCCTQKLPILYIQNSPGYMVGTEEEYAGIGKYGSNMVRAGACANVPKIQWVIGPDHGAANYGMCGRAYDPNFIFNTMRGRTSVMSGRTAGHILTTLERANTKKRGQNEDEKKFQKFEQEMIDKYSREAHPFYTEARMYHDGTLPLNMCRGALATAFEVSLLKPIQQSSFGNFKF